MKSASAHVPWASSKRYRHSWTFRKVDNFSNKWNQFNSNTQTYSTFLIKSFRESISRLFPFDKSIFYMKNYFIIQIHQISFITKCNIIVILTIFISLSFFFPFEKCRFSCRLYMYIKFLYLFENHSTTYPQ